MWYHSIHVWLPPLNICSLGSNTCALRAKDYQLLTQLVCACCMRMCVSTCVRKSTQTFAIRIHCFCMRTNFLYHRIVSEQKPVVFTK